MNPTRIAAFHLMALCAPLFAQSTGLSYERWDGIGGGSLEDFRQEALNVRAPDHVGTVTLAKAPVDIGNSRGARLRGQLIAPATGECTFFIAGDKNAELWLSHDSQTDTTAPWNRRLIAWNRQAVGDGEWTKYATQRSEAIALEAGESYYIEAVVKTDAGANHLSVGWNLASSKGPALSSFSAVAATIQPVESSPTTFSVASGDIASTRDRGAFYHQPWSGDGVFTMQIGGLNDLSQWAKAGLMIRESLTENSRHAFLCVTSRNGTHFFYRATDGGTTQRPTATNTIKWQYIRLARSGNTITSTVSADGITWQANSSYTFSNLAQDIHVGFAASSYSNQVAAPFNGWFTPLEARVSLQSDPVTLPNTTMGRIYWNPNNIVFQPREDGGMNFTVRSNPIHSKTDTGAFHAREWTGDGDFITRIDEIASDSSGATAGLMLRATLHTQSRHIYVARGPSNQLTLRFRKANAGSTTLRQISPADAAERKWLKLARAGNTVHASTSADGITWDAWESVTFTNNDLPPTVLVGQAVSSASTTLDATGSFGHLTVRPFTASEVIPGDCLVPFASHVEDPLDRGLPDAWMTANQLDPLETFGANSPFGDPDADGLDNLTEYQRASHPLDKAPAQGLLTREMWTDLTVATVKDFTNHESFYGRPAEISLVPRLDSIMPRSTGTLYFGARYRGEIVAPATGDYRFWLSASDHAELWLADGTITPRGEQAPRRDRFGKRCIAWKSGDSFWLPTPSHQFDLYASQRSVLIHLEEGQSYYLEVLHKNTEVVPHIAVAWQPPGADREFISEDAFRSHMPSPEDADNDGLPDAWQTDKGLDAPGYSSAARGEYGDPDGDGLLNLLEYQHGTNPLNTDTDSDGLSDTDEIFFYSTDPLVSNALAPVLAAAPVLHQYSGYTGGWTHNGDGSLSAWDRRGKISYTFTLAEDGIHEVVIKGAAIGSVRPVEHLPLVLSLNGGPPFASKTLVSEDGGQGSIHAITPILKAGQYTLSILHDNYRAAPRLRLDSIEILRLGGTDLNEDGIPDWAMQNAAAANSLTRAPSTSRTSPVSIEGITQSLAATTLTYTSHGGIEALPLEIQDSVNDSFYTDVPLSEGGPVAIQASFLGGLHESTSNITWVSTNLFEFDQNALHIRKGDALRLTAHSGQTASGSFIIGCATLPSLFPTEATDAEAPVSITFDTPGTHTLTATWTPDEGQQVTTTVTLHVHEADLGPLFSVQVNTLRTWSPVLLGPSHLVEADDALPLLETTANPQTGPRTFRAAAVAPADRHVIARLPHNIDGAPSAILSRTTAKVFYLGDINQSSDAQLVMQYPDGTWLMSGSMVAVNLPTDMLIKLSAVYPGTVFHNGAGSLWLDASNFDENGITNIFFEWSGTGSPKLCHYIELFSQP